MKFKGFFTTQKYLQGQNLKEIERRLGFRPGRLSKGATFLAASRIPTLNEFELAGYSQVAAHQTLKRYGNINSAETDQKREALERQKRLVTNQWSLNGSNRLIKVLPGIRHNPNMSEEEQYPPGTGIPQWRITAVNGIPNKEICVISDYPHGKFQP